MKTILSARFLLMISSVSLILASCTKVPSSLPDNGPGTNPNQNLPTAIIQDNGLVDGASRLMVTTLTNQSITLVNSNEELAGTGAEVSFDFFTTEDGLVPSGVYAFNGSGQVLPFTFRTGALKSAVISGSPVFVDQQITGGSVYVTQNGSDYQISFDCTLSTGDSFRGMYTGSAMYQDVSVKK